MYTPAHWCWPLNVATFVSPLWNAKAMVERSYVHSERTRVLAYTITEMLFNFLDCVECSSVKLPATRRMLVPVSRCSVVLFPEFCVIIDIFFLLKRCTSSAKDIPLDFKRCNWISEVSRLESDVDVRHIAGKEIRHDVKIPSSLSRTFQTPPNISNCCILYFDINLYATCEQVFSSYKITLSAHITIASP